MSLDGKDRQILAEASPDRDAVAVSSDGTHVAFFTDPFDSDGALIVWDTQQGTMWEMSTPAEVSTSFRDSLALRHLAWAPDSQRLAAVVNRDLHLLDMTQRTAQVIVRHREERYNLAGLVMGSITHPTWTTDGRRIIYDTFAPPEVLSADADEYRDVEYVDVSTRATKTLLEDAHIVPGRPAPGGQELILQHDDGRIFSLNLGTLEMQETTQLPSAQSPPLCLTQNGSCVSIVSDQEGYSALAFAQPGGETHRVSLEDLGESATECQFQSTLWGPGGDSLLTTVACPMRVGLWSMRLSDLEATHLTDWAGAGSAILLTWFE
jgi:Tol biopolymer transport system component